MVMMRSVMYVRSIRSCSSMTDLGHMGSLQGGTSRVCKNESHGHFRGSEKFLCRSADVCRSLSLEFFLGSYQLEFQAGKIFLASAVQSRSALITLKSFSRVVKPTLSGVIGEKNKELKKKGWVTGNLLSGLWPEERWRWVTEEWCRPNHR